MALDKQCEIAAPTAPDVTGEPQRRHFSWIILPAIPLFIYGIIVAACGGMGFLFLPGILLGGISIGHHTTLPKVIAFVLLHAALLAHGWFVVVAAWNLFKSRWMRAKRAIMIAVGFLLAAAICIWGANVILI